MPDSNLTKRALAQAMKDLMAQRPFQKISVGDICDQCGMNRKSFYYHFRDKYDLVNWIFYSEFMQSVQSANYETGWAFLSDMFRYFYTEQAFYRCAMQITGQNCFRDYFGEVVNPVLLSFSHELFSGMEGDAAFYVTFFSDAFLASIIRWLTEGARIPPDEYLSQLRHIIIRLARQVLTDLDKQDGRG